MMIVKVGMRLSRPYLSSDFVNAQSITNSFLIMKVEGTSGEIQSPKLALVIQYDATKFIEKGKRSNALKVKPSWDGPYKPFGAGKRSGFGNMTLCLW